MPRTFVAMIWWDEPVFNCDLIAENGGNGMAYRTKDILWWNTTEDRIAGMDPTDQWGWVLSVRTWPNVSRDKREHYVPTRLYSQGTLQWRVQDFAERATASRRGALTYYLAYFFSENCGKMKKNWTICYYFTGENRMWHNEWNLCRIRTESLRIWV